MVRGEDEGEEAFGLSESLNPEIPMNSAKMKQIGDLHGEEKNSLQNTGKIYYIFNNSVILFNFCHVHYFNCFCPFLS